MTNGCYRITIDGQTAIMKACPRCGMITPHKVTEAGRQCGICELVESRA